MNSRFRNAFLNIVIIPFLAMSMSPPAFAAKGIKNAPLPNASRVWTGKIVGIDVPHQVFRLESIRTERSTAWVNGVAVPRLAKHKVFTDLAVTPATIVHRQDGLLLPQAALQIGSNIRVQSIGKTASSVTVTMPRHRVGYAGYAVRARPRAYHPHVYHLQHASHLHHNHHRKK